VNTPRKPDDDLDRLLADDGGELGALYRRLPRMEPPRRLDRNVLGEAARAIHGRPPRRQRWLVGLGSAAGIVLAAGVAWHVGQDALHQQSYEPARSAPTYVPVQPLDESARRKHDNAPAATDAMAPPPAPAPAAPAAAAPMEFQHRRSAPPVDKAKKEVAPAAQSAPPPMAAAAPPPPPAVSTPSEPFSSADKSAAATSTDAEAKGNLAGSAAREQESGRSEEAANASLAAPKPARSTTGPAPTSSAELRRDMQLAPEDWLAHIQQLLRQGRRQQAIESLQLFRRAHPDWQLSDELRALSE
jgi:hypothetical protein